MKKSRYLSLVSGLLFLFASSAYAVCPVCTVAVGAGLEGARLLGVADAITGAWAGAFTLIMVFWTARYMSRKGIENAIWYIFDLVVWYVLLAAVYFTPNVEYGKNTVLGADQFLVGIVSGSVVFYAAEKWNHSLLHKNGGKSYFKFQKVVIPFCSLLLLSAALGVLVLYYKG
ncbi:MAG: hypothetical protein LBT45_00135 [Rickettsiales bacterium]|jgi:hypothetical protein|nr:hypothetical protein [Rickettsiales bacterium]